MKFLRILFISVTVLLLVSLPAKPTRAAVPLEVDTTVDEQDGSCSDGDCSLRDAVALVDGTNAYTIRFDASLSGQTITLLNALPIQKSLTIDGSTLASHVRLSGNNLHRVIYIEYEAGTPDGFIVTIKSVDIINGAAGTANGGGIYNDGGMLTVQDVYFESNTATSGYGGAIHCDTTNDQPDLIVEDSDFYLNSASFGGGINIIGNLTITDSQFEGNSSSWSGGAIFINGTGTVTGSTFYSNIADTGGDTHEGNGAAIYLYGGTTTIANSTLAHNTAENFGGGIYINNSAILNITNGTMSENVATNDQGGNIYNHYGTLNMQNTILANSPSGDGYDCYNEGGSITANLNSLIEYNGPTTFSCGTPAQTGDPQLAVLALNSPGTTPTMAIPKTSPAFNNGNNTVCAAAVGSPMYGADAVDQRGVIRPQGGTCDIGAYELEITASALGDYDGDGDTELAVRRSSKFYISGIGAFGWGLPTDLPVPADYDGDGDVDIAVFRSGKWFIKDIGTFTWGMAGDIPVPADYDGDGAADLAFRRGAKFYIMGVGNFGWGLETDIPVPADYNGDGAAEIAVFRDGKWFIKDFGNINYGIAGDIPVPADYDGNGAVELAVRRGGRFYISGIGNFGWGLSTDIPVPGDYNGDGTYDIAVFRDGKWLIKDIGTFNYGIAGDYPLPAPDTNADGDPYQ